MPNNLNANPYYQSMQAFDDPRNSLEAAATLALAFEQARTADAIETANLIAFVGLFPNPEGREQLHDLITERLGLA
jgi:hypothetical protein